jgi:hypothetical protein
MSTYTPIVGNPDPITFTAFQYTGVNAALISFMGATNTAQYELNNRQIYVRQRVSAGQFIKVPLSIGDYVVTDPYGGFIVMKASLFESLFLLA